MRQNILVIYVSDRDSYPEYIKNGSESIRRKGQTTQ